MPPDLEIREALRTADELTRKVENIPNNPYVVVDIILPDSDKRPEVRYKPTWQVLHFNPDEAHVRSILEHKIGVFEQMSGIDEE